MDDFEEYVKRYADQLNQNGISVDEAKEHKIVQEVKAYYDSERKEVIL